MGLFETAVTHIDRRDLSAFIKKCIVWTDIIDLMRIFCVSINNIPAVIVEYTEATIVD
jgi:hypothetical protein